MNKEKFVGLYKRLLDQKFLIFSDQALYAFFNFGSIFLLSKLASINVFGSYVIFLSYTNFVFIFSTFFLSAPILVLLSKNWKHKQQSYLLTLLCSNFVISLVLSGICYIVIKYLGEDIKFIYVFLVPFCMSMIDILKKFLFSILEISLIHVTISSLLLNVVFFTSIFIAKESLSFVTILAIYIASFVIANIYILCVLIIKKTLNKKALSLNAQNTSNFKVIIKEHYTYSKWIMLGGIAFWGYSQGLFIMSKSLMVTDFGIGKVRTIQNIFGLVNIFTVSIENYYIPYFSNFVKKNSNKELVGLVKKLYAKNYKKGILLFLIVFPSGLVGYSLFYESKYGSGLFLLVIFSITQFILLFIRPLIISLKVIEVTYPFFIAHIVAVITMVFFGYFAITYYGYNGMGLTFLISNISFVLVVAYFYNKKINKN
jgi:O-antigen/teichoic acid export membrane protein